MTKVAKAMVALVGVMVCGRVGYGGVEGRPNVLLIVADDLGYGDCSAYARHAGDVRTPCIDAIGGAGVVFTNGYDSAPVCSPSRTGMISGRYQERWNKAAGWVTDLPKRATTIAEHLHDLGYATMMIGKNDFGVHLPSKEDRRYPMNHGYDRLLGFEAHAHDYYLLTKEIEEKATVPHGTSANVGPLDFDRGEKDFPGAYTTDLFTDAAIGFAKENAEKGTPFFVALAYNAVHDLVEQVPGNYLEKYGATPIPLYEPSMGTYEKYYNIYNRLGKVNEKQMRQYYLANLACLDDNVGRLMGALATMGVAENTLVVFISDNGGSPNTGGNCSPLRGSKYTAFEGGIRVPLMMKWAGKVKAGQVVDTPVISLDLLPTFVEAAGGEVKKEEGLDGVSLLPLAERGEGMGERTLYWKFLKQWAVREGDWKLEVARQGKMPGGIAHWVLKGEESDEPRLYNLKEDLQEQKDVSAEHPEVVKELTEKFEIWEKTHGEWAESEGKKEAVGFPEWGWRIAEAE